MIARPLWRALLAWLFCTLFSVAAVHAERGEDSWFVLEIDPCVRVRSRAVIPQLSIELGRLHRRDPPIGGPVLVQVTCAGVKTVLHVTPPGAGYQLVRSVDLSYQPDLVRARLLALALAELLAATVGEEDRDNPAGEPPPPSPPDPPPQKKEPASAPVQEPPIAVSQVPPPPAPMPPSAARAATIPAVAASAWRVVALATSQVFFSDALFLLGGGLGFGWDAPRHLGLFVDLLARHGTATDPLGRIVVDTVSIGATLAFWGGGSRVHLRGGPGVRAGLVRFHGQPADATQTQGGTFFGGWLAPVANLSGTVKLSRHVALEAATDVGYVALPVTGQAAGAPAAAIAGGFFGLNVGIAIFR